MPAQQTSKSYLSTLTIIHAALMMTQIMFGAVAYFLKSNGTFNNDAVDISNVLMIIVPVIAVGGIAASTFVSKLQISSARQKSNLKEKLEAYRGALLIKLALLEAPTLFALVCYLLTGKILLIGFALAILVLFYINRPTINNIVMDLELNQMEKTVIENPNSTIE